VQLRSLGARVPDQNQKKEGHQEEGVDPGNGKDLLSPSQKDQGAQHPAGDHGFDPELPMIAGKKIVEACDGRQEKAGDREAGQEQTFPSFFEAESLQIEQRGEEGPEGHLCGFASSLHARILRVSVHQMEGIVFIVKAVPRNPGFHPSDRRGFDSKVGERGSGRPV